MRRNATLITLLAVEAGVAAFALFFQLHARPLVLRAFAEFDTALPPATALALAPWFLPAALVAAAGCTAVALLAKLRRSRRPIVISAGLVILCFALIFAVWAAFMPVFQPA
jgi:hypothetical protein